MKPNLEKTYTDFIEVYKIAHPMMTKQDCQKAYNSEWAILKKELGEGNDARLKKVNQVFLLHKYSDSSNLFSEITV